tara:strand:+ start:974 stop:1297 length:324 start_codon:yes stop_codon:yes gene_type:complete
LAALDKLLEQSGWDALEIDDLAQARSRHAQANESREIATRFHECFRTDSGRYVLNRLIQITVLRPTVTPTSTQFEAGIREGRADLVRQILAQLDIAETDKPGALFNE